MTKVPAIPARRAGTKCATELTSLADSAKLLLVAFLDGTFGMSGVPDSRAKSGMPGVLRSLPSRPSEIWRTDVNPAQSLHYPRALRVLVCDDSPVNLMVISALLGSRGVCSLLTGDGVEAVTLACELHFDLILMDLQMPILDGLGATSAIRRFEASRSRPAVPVVAYSSSRPDWSELAMHGFNGSLAKPCADHELEDCLVRWCPTYRPADSPDAAGQFQVQEKFHEHERGA